MVEDRLSDGVRIAELLASEISGNQGRLREFRVTDADPDVTPTADGALAYTVVRGPDPDHTGEPTEESPDRTGEPAEESPDRTGEPTEESPERIAEVYVQPGRVRVEFVVAVDSVADAARERGLRVRPKAVRPPRTLVFLEDGAQVKWVLSAFETT